MPKLPGGSLTNYLTTPNVLFLFLIPVSKNVLPASLFQVWIMQNKALTALAKMNT
jgi:hypothetical protein